MSNLPETMTAIAIPVPGGPEALVPETRPLPQISGSEILIRVKAAGVNRPDVFQRQGAYPPPPGASDLPGLEVAGEVAAVGPAATRFKVGDAVVALTAGGGYAEFCKVEETNALAKPDVLSFEEGAAVPETFFTVWSNVFDRGGLKAGESLLVHGGTSGIGTTAIQLAKAFGATVYTTAGGAEKCAFCAKLGVDLAIDYRAQDFVDEIRKVTDKRGVDLILDMVGGDYVPRNWKAAAVEGRIVQIATLHGATDTADFRVLMAKRLTHTGSTLRPRDTAFKAAIAAALEEKVWPLIAQGKVKPVMDSTFALTDASKAHARMESSGHIGKIVLTV
ncbi:putative PIG3 family NAD(P)H quinone oxidoreductase [Breoghania corrubedonensis]|uniref:Putative PIG3 family NAD(P)H quinone oxidoreductase n=1 Tax=Breoghania corrubedonensis TaxID=665038 RepID=A0A2T5V7C5_9HYPH|nr:NAD(P)H-quinone oxidoreductase [Breoghania corrubedonensis]PTW59647.1 putative PIG3 family NAD(P)H quinone oxidoreductase [Breoghania corrubedonensis]